MRGEISAGTVVPIAVPEIEERQTVIRSVRVSIDGAAVPDPSTITNVGTLAKMCLEDRIAGIRTKTIARTIGKQLLAQKIERSVSKSKGKWQGLLAGLVAKGIAYSSEKADTRTWRELPGRIALGRWEVTAGKPHVLRIDYLDISGAIMDTEQFEFQVPDRRGVVVWRRACR